MYLLLDVQTILEYVVERIEILIKRMKSSLLCFRI